MPTRRLYALARLTLGLTLVAGSAYAQATQTPAKPFEPQVGQAGKDVVWVPTPQALVDKMLDMAKVTPAGLPDRSRIRRRADGHHGGQARR